MAAKALPCPTLLRLLLDYNPETGKLTWKPRPAALASSERASKIFNAKFAGRPACASASSHGHLQANLPGRSKTYAHRVAWTIHYGEWPVGSVDHVDGNPANNSIVNLRACGQQQNTWNMTASKKGTSRFKGVSLGRGRWQATIMRDGRQIYLGRHATEEQAARAYDRAALAMFGRYARLNFPEDRDDASSRPTGK